MSINLPEYEYVDRQSQSIRYLEVGWPTWAARWHAHPEYELHLITATRGKAFVGDYVGEFEAGDLFLTGPDVPHNWVTDPAIYVEPLEARDMLVQFSHETIETLCLAFPEFHELTPMWEMSRSGIRFRGFDPTLAQELFGRIRDAHGVDRILAFLHFLVLANKHADKCTLSVVSVSHNENSVRQVRISDVVDYVTHNYAEPISLAGAAKIAGMSRSTFSRNFHSVTGNKFVEFVSRVRVGQACAVLYATDRPVSAISHEVGFHSLASFNRQFLRMKKMTPTAYRDAARAGRLGRQSYTCLTR